MATEPTWDARGEAPPTASRPIRTSDEERVLTEFAHNYLIGRRWLCRLAHVCAGLGAAIVAIAAAWDHIAAAAEHLSRILHSH